MTKRALGPGARCCEADQCCPAEPTVDTFEVETPEVEEDEE